MEGFIKDIFLFPLPDGAVYPVQRLPYYLIGRPSG